MGPRPYEIWLVKRMWRNCPDRRPWLVIEDCKDGTFSAFPISGVHYDETEEAFPIDPASGSAGAAGG